MLMRKLRWRSLLSYLLLGLLFVGTTLGCIAVGRQVPSATVAQMVEGDDWSLPRWAAKSPNSGIYSWNPPDVERPDALMLDLTWKEVNPQQNVFNWKRLEAALAGKQPIWVRLYASDVVHTPDWLAAKYQTLKPLRFEPYRDTVTGKSQGYFYPLWHPGVQAEFKKVLADFKRRGFAANPKLLFMYAPGAWRWNEWEVSFVRDLRQAGMTPDKFFQWFRTHIDDYVDAFGGYTYKLVYTGSPQMDPCQGDMEWIAVLNDFATGKNRMTSYAVSQGMSVRVGQLELFNRFSDLPSWGAPAVTVGNYRYQTIDPNNGLQRNPQRILGTENEGFGDPGMLNAQVGYFMKMVMLKSLQLRLNWVNTNNYSYRLTPVLMEYARKTLGKRVTNSPDAWVVLREWRDPSYLGPDSIPGVPESRAFFKTAQLPYRNWERWLIHRPIGPDGVSQATQKLELTGRLQEFEKVNGASYEALRTDHATGNDYLYFGVDDQFLKGGSHAVQVKITYLDNNSARWGVEYDAASGGAYKKTSLHTNRNTGKWQTVTFSLPDAAFGNRQRGNMDFRIYNGGQADLTVRFVRVVKTNPPLRI